MKHWRDGRENPKCPEKTLSQCQSVLYKSPMDRIRRERRETFGRLFPALGFLKAVSILDMPPCAEAGFGVAYCVHLQVNVSTTQCHIAFRCFPQAPTRIRGGRFQRQVGHDATDAVTMVTRDSPITGLAPKCAIDTHIRDQHAFGVQSEDKPHTDTLKSPCPMLGEPSLNSFRWVSSVFSALKYHHRLLSNPNHIRLGSVTTRAVDGMHIRIYLSCYSDPQPAI